MNHGLSSPSPAHTCLLRVVFPTFSPTPFITCLRGVRGELSSSAAPAFKATSLGFALTSFFLSPAGLFPGPHMHSSSDCARLTCVSMRMFVHTCTQTVHLSGMQMPGLEMVVLPGFFPLSVSHLPGLYLCSLHLLTNVL